MSGAAYHKVNQYKLQDREPGKVLREGKQMQMQEKETRMSNTTLDALKVLAAILITGSHQLPIFTSDVMNLYYGHWFFRFCVPVFFLSSGYYFAKMDRARQASYVGRIGRLYLLSTILYLPLIWKDSLRMEASAVRTWYIRCAFFGYFHLWYLSALFIALLLLYLILGNSSLGKCLKRIELFVIAALMLAGILFDNYFYFFDVPLIQKIGLFLKDFGGSRNFLMFAMPVLLIGKVLAEHEEYMEKPTAVYLTGLFVTAGLALLESILLVRHLGDRLACDITLFNIWPAVFMFILTFRVRIPLGTAAARILRKCVDILYIIHPWIIYYFARYQWPGPFNFAVTTSVSLMVSLGIVLFVGRYAGVGKRIAQRRKSR